VVVERREGRGTQPSIRHCIQQTVACSCQKEICPHRQAANLRQPAQKFQKHNGTRQDSGKNERVSEPPVPPKVTVSDAEQESNNIKVRNNRAQCTFDPNSFWNAGLVKERSEPKGGHREGNDAIRFRSSPVFKAVLRLSGASQAGHNESSNSSDHAQCILSRPEETNQVRVGMEAIGYSRWFEWPLAELGFEVWIGGPAEFKTRRVKKLHTNGHRFRTKRQLWSYCG
jgi:hypothetical protein